MKVTPDTGPHYDPRVTREKVDIYQGMQHASVVGAELLCPGNMRHLALDATQ